jgi:hypothetical protein
MEMRSGRLLLITGMLLTLCICILSAAVASAENREVKVEIIPTISNNTIVMLYVRVNGTLFGPCSGNNCTAYLQITDCPACPAAVDADEIIDSISDYVETNTKDLMREIKNGSLDQGHLEDKISEENAAVIAAIREDLEKAYVPQKWEFDNLTQQINDLQVEARVKDEKIGRLEERRTELEKQRDAEQHRSYIYMFIAGIFSLILVGLVVKGHGGTLFSQQGVLSKFRGSMTSREKVVAERNQTISDKDRIIAEKDVEIERIRQKIAVLEKTSELNELVKKRDSLLGKTGRPVSDTDKGGIGKGASSQDQQVENVDRETNANDLRERISEYIKSQRNYEHDINGIRNFLKDRRVSFQEHNYQLLSRTALSVRLEISRNRAGEWVVLKDNPMKFRFKPQ